MVFQMLMDDGFDDGRDTPVFLFRNLLDSVEDVGGGLEADGRVFFPLSCHHCATQASSISVIPERDFLSAMGYFLFITDILLRLKKKSIGEPQPLIPRKMDAIRSFMCNTMTSYAFLNILFCDTRAVVNITDSMICRLFINSR